MTWQTVHFALRRAHQRYLFMNSKHHKSDAFLLVNQLLLVKKMKYICEHIICEIYYEIYEITHYEIYMCH